MKRKITHLFTLLILASTFFYCKSKKMEKNESPVTINTKEVVKELMSPDKSKKLIMSYIEDINPRKTFAYKVLSTKTKSELLKGTFTGMKLEWNDNNSLKGHLYQGMIRDDEASSDADKFKIIQIN